MPRLALGIVACWLAAAAAGGWYTATSVEISTDTADMLAADLPFRQAYDRYRRAFPEQVDALVVVVEAPAAEQAQAGATALAERLRRRPDLFVRIDVPEADPFLARNALLYLDEPDLTALAERLIGAQPFIGLLHSDPGLRRFADSLTLFLREPGATDAGPLLREFARAAQAESQPGDYATSWQSLLTGHAGSPSRALVFVKPVVNWNDLLAAAAPIGEIRAAATELRRSLAPSITVSITGDAALAHEEIDSALGSSLISVSMALVVIAVVLGWGLQSAWMTAAALITLGTGLCITAAFATWAAGELNLLSFAAAVLYLGLGVDYAMHFGLRYREALASGANRRTALRRARSEVRGALLLCAATTACGFFAFVPTDFAGIAQLGLICGTGMFINLVVTLTLLPALLELVPMPAPWPGAPRQRQVTHIDAWLRRRAVPVRFVSVAAALGALLLLPGVSFDREPLNLRDPRSESVATLRALQGDPNQPLAGITVLAPDARSAERQAALLRQLPAVGQVTTAADLRPEVSTGKLAIIDELAVLLEPALSAPAQPAPATDMAVTTAALEELRSALNERLAVSTADDQPDLRAALTAIDSLLDRPEQQRAGALTALEQRLLVNLPLALERLQTALHPDLRPQPPDSLVRRWVAADGTQRIVVYPREPFDPATSLRAFVDAVQAVAPDATDEPVLNLRAGDAIVASFARAMTIAVACAVVLLLTLLRDLRRTALALMPLGLAGLLTAATLALAGVPFNYANIVAVPLLLGANMDNGIHMVHRYYDSGGEDLAQTSTSRAIIFSGLANLCGFANLLTSSHPGTASMGLVLTVGMAWTLTTTMLVVPALLIRRPAGAQPG